MLTITFLGNRDFRLNPDKSGRPTRAGRCCMMPECISNRKPKQWWLLLHDRGEPVWLFTKDGKMQKCRPVVGFGDSLPCGRLLAEASLVLTEQHQKLAWLGEQSCADSFLAEQGVGSTCFAAMWANCSIRNTQRILSPVNDSSVPIGRHDVLEWVVRSFGWVPSPFD